MFKHEIRMQMSVCFETYQIVIQSTPMAGFSFGFTKGSFLLLNDQKQLRSVAEDLILHETYDHWSVAVLTVTVHSSFFPTFDFSKNMLLSALDSIC